MYDITKNKKAIITLAKRLKHARKYNPSSAARFSLPISSALSKIIANNFNPKIVLLIDILSGKLNDSESPDVTLKRILNDLKIFLVVHIGDKSDYVYCYCDSGTYSCDECEIGQVTCDNCDGAGSLIGDDDEEHECEVCNGTGEVTCRYCGGEGFYECSECNGSGYYDEGPYANITPRCYYTLDREAIDIYSDLALDIYDVDSKPTNAGNIYAKDSHYFELIESFEVNSEIFGEGVINFEIKNEYYNGSYVLGVFDLFDPRITISLNGIYFMADFEPKIESILDTHFT